MEDAQLTAARQALERGDYGRVLQLLEPLAQCHPAASSLGAGIRLLMATALMGQGRTEQAADCCRGLQRCPDLTLRAQARDLLQVLEAPQLQRPREWSLTLPDLSQGRPLEELRGGRGRGRSRQPPPAPPPPVGDTRPPLGFAAFCLALVAALLLAALLTGCMEVRTDLHFEGPGRLQLSHRLRSDSGAPSPWQQRFAAALESQGFQRSQPEAGLTLSTPVLPARQALAALLRSVQDAGQLSGRALPEPQAVWEERNCWLGVVQELKLDLDLRELADLQGLTLTLALDPLSTGAVRQAAPDGVFRQGRSVLWPLRPGALNQLELRCWRWSALGLGSLLIPLALLLSLGLQTLRRRLGFGFPELPAAGASEPQLDATARDHPAGRG